jgi:exodeoxyribonuclease V alpha subunit
MRIRIGETIEAEGTVENIRYASDDGEFQVIVLKTTDGDRVPCVVRGAGLLVDEQVKVSGEGSRHRSGELQIEVEQAKRVLPATRDGLVRFLSSSLIDGVGPKIAEEIVNHFGEDTGKILTNEPERLREVDGIGPERAEKIRESWSRNEAIRGIIIFLQSHGISTAYANRIYRRYGQKAVSVLRDNPYRLARDVRGIGFIAADRIARNFGIGVDDPRRHEAGLEYVLHMARGEGHMYLPEQELIAASIDSLGASEEQVRNALDALVSRRELVREPRGEEGNDAIFPLRAFRVETDLASKLDELISRKSRIAAIDDNAWQRIQSYFDFELSNEQKQALKSISGQPVAILTGGPGTGKTTIVRALVEHARQLKASIALAAPTGRAAQRLNEATGEEAKTIHRLLEFDPRQGGFTRDDVEPLDEDLIIIDEASMLDAELARSLFRAVGPGANLILVGNKDQLPPVGPGRVLADLINPIASPSPASTASSVRARAPKSSPPHTSSAMAKCLKAPAPQMANSSSFGAKSPKTSSIPSAR